MEAYGCAVFKHGLELHMDGRHRRRDRLGVLTFESVFGSRGGPRGEIRGFTIASRRRLAWLLANAPTGFANHATFTYHARVDESDGEQVAQRNRELVERSKVDLNRFLACVRREVGAYCWIQEFQKRGAVHFHALFEREVPERRLAIAWCGATGQLHDPHALEHAVRVRAVEDQTAARKYLVRYFGKSAQKQLPSGVERAGRFWGCSRVLRVGPVEQVETCQPKGRRHDRDAVRVRRAFQRFVSRAVGFKWRGGRLACWKPELPARALDVLRRLRTFYRDPGYLRELVERWGWEPADEAVERRRARLDPWRDEVPEFEAEWVEAAEEVA